jgi:hypothetical protein
MSQSCVRSLAQALALGAALFAAPAAHAVVLSVQVDGQVVGGVAYSRFDVVWLDTVSNTSQLLLDNSAAFGTQTRVDAFQALPGDLVAFSILPASRVVGGITVNDGDVVLYDPVNDLASLLLDESDFATGAEVDAFQVLPNGHLLLSTADTEVLFGVTFRDGDIVDYDPFTDTVVLVFDEDVFAANEDVDALWLGSDGAYYLSTGNGASLAGLSFQGDDVVRWDPLSGVATLALDGASLPANVVLASGFLPEPGLLALCSGVIGLVGLVLFPRLSRGRAPADEQ